MSCQYQGHEFGAHYPDSVCINGYLWDADSGGTDDNGQQYLTHGGEMPCPRCNMKEHISYFSDEWDEMGYMSVYHPCDLQMMKDSLKWKTEHVAISLAAKLYFTRGRLQGLLEQKIRSDKEEILRSIKARKAAKIQ